MTTIGRRELIAGAGAALSLLSTRTARAEGEGRAPASLSNWSGVRGAFSLSPDYIHLAGLLLASHPTPVRDAIDRYRRELDANPVSALEKLHEGFEDEIFHAAERFIGAKDGEVALTDSTTMGLGLVYTGMVLDRGDEIICSDACHYSTREAFRMAAVRWGANAKTITMYKDPHRATEGEIVKSVVAAVTPKTKVIGLTWVHSGTGVKIPVSKISAEIKKLNKKRKAKDQILFCVDGVHGFGIENVVMSDFGCDFFIAGTHKWLFGPRGTGLVWGWPEAWARVSQSIAPFDLATFKAWLGRKPTTSGPLGRLMTPGGFHSFEHRWALKEAFAFQTQIGRARIEKRTHQLGRQLKEGMAKMKHIELKTPMSETLSSGIVCFDVKGKKPDQVVAQLAKKKIIGSTTPYYRSYARLTPAVFNTEQEIDAALRALREQA